MSEVFGHYLKTGSGSTIARLTLSSDNMAIIEYDSRWMGSGSSRFRIHLHHHKVSEFHGFLALRAIERYISLYSDDTVTESISSILEDFSEDRGEVPVPFRDMTYEYVRLPTSQLWLADAPDLEDMSHFFNLARWPETFDLILWLHFSYKKAIDEWEDNQLTRMLESLDRMKFTTKVNKEFFWPKPTPYVPNPKLEEQYWQHFPKIRIEATPAAPANSETKFEESDELSNKSDTDISSDKEPLYLYDEELDEEGWEALLTDNIYRYKFNVYV